MAGQVSATASFEVEVGLTGSLQPGERSTHNDPGHDPFIEDGEVDGLSALKRVDGKWVNIDLMVGMDPKSACTRALLSNIAAFLGADIDEALLEAGSE